MQGGHDEVAGIGRAHRGAEADGVSHLADHDDVGVLSHDVLEAVLIRRRVEADFALLDDGLLVLEHVLDRILYGDDVAFLGGVDVIDHPGKGGGLAAAGGSGDQHDATVLLGDGLDDLGQAEAVDFRNLGDDVAHGEAPLAEMLVAVCPEPANAGNVIRKVDFPIFFQFRLELLRNDVVDDIAQPLRIRLLAHLGLHQLAADAVNHRRVRLDVDVGSAAFDGGIQDFVKQFHIKNGWIGKQESSGPTSAKTAPGQAGLPFDDGRAPSQAGPEDQQQYQVAALNFALLDGFVQRDGYRGGGGVAIAL